MKVTKFGGTSLANAEQIKKVSKIIESDTERKIIVVSAPGKRFSDDKKVTDLLIDYANKIINEGAAKKELDLILERFVEIGKGLNLSNNQIGVIVSDLVQTLMINVKDKITFIETIKSTGENTTAKLLSIYLKNIGIESNYINPRDAGFYVSNEYGNAQILPESYENLKFLKSRAGVKVFPGYFGCSKQGEIITFPRGGSDITGSILAAATKADIYENFTDVDSVYVVNPKFIPNPIKIDELTFQEMRELSYAGFTVFNDEALFPVFKAGIPVNIKNTNNPTAKGTKIIFDKPKSNNPITGIASDNGFCSIYISKYLMNREIGFGRKLLEILEDEGLSYEHTPSGIDNISIILREKNFNPQVEKKVLYRINTELNIDDIKVQKNLALVMVVGERMRNTKGLAARATKAFANAGVNIEMINQGSSEVSMMFGIKVEDEEKAVKSLYYEFFKK